MGVRVTSVAVSAPAVDMSASGRGGGDAVDGLSPAKTPPSAPAIKISDIEVNGKPAIRSNNSSPSEQTVATAASSAMSAPLPGAAVATASAVQPKIVQTAFIHKLYNMLEDSKIQHLISWSANSESFVMSPTADFSKVLSQYFKHTNISSFVRQLNMYGFHKERDVFHTGNPDTTLWEFRHGTGSFKRGNLVGLREIKRRASRHALVHREGSVATKQGSSQANLSTDPLPLPPESAEARLASLEHNLYDLSSRLQRSEESAHYMHTRSQTVFEAMNRLLHLNQELSRAMLSVVPSDSPAYRDVVALQGEMQRQADLMRSLDDSHETSPFAVRPQHYSSADNAPVSPRQLPQDDAKRPGGLAVPQCRVQPLHRPMMLSSISTGPRRRYGSIGGGSTPQPSSTRAAAPPPAPPGPHPLSHVEPPPGSLARRHTAADIRAHGWQASSSPFPTPTPPIATYPSPPARGVLEDQRIRDSLWTYSLQTASCSHPQSRPATPPPAANGGTSNGSDTFGSWSWNSAAARDGKGFGAKDSPAPPTRRGSMAHILNPSDTAERSDEDGEARGDDVRKRQRMQ